MVFKQNEYVTVLNIFFLPWKLALNKQQKKELGEHTILKEEQVRENHAGRKEVEK